MELDKYKIIEPFLKKEKKLKEISESSNIPYSTLKRWIKSYKDSGIEGLKKKSRVDKNTHRKPTKEIMNYILGEYKKNPAITPTLLYKKYIKTFKDKKIPKISYNTIYRIFSNLDSYSQKEMKKNLKEIKKPNLIYRISTEKLYIKNLEKNKVVTLLIIYDVYDDSILDYRFYVGELDETHYKIFIRDSLLNNQLGDYLVLPKNILIDKFKIRDKNYYLDVLKEIDININGSFEKNEEITRFVRFLEEDIQNKFKDRSITIEDLNNKLQDLICNKNLEGRYISNKLDDFNKLDIFLEESKRKVQNYGIRFKNILYNDPILKKYLGKIVTLKYDPFDCSFLKIYLDDKFVGEIYRT